MASQGLLILANLGSMFANFAFLYTIAKRTEAVMYVSDSLSINCDIFKDFLACYILYCYEVDTFADIRATAGASMGLRKKAALATLGTFSGVRADVAYKLDQSGNNQSEHSIMTRVSHC